MRSGRRCLNAGTNVGSSELNKDEDTDCTSPYHVLNKDFFYETSYVCCRAVTPSHSFFIHLPMKMEQIEGSETSAIRTKTPGNYPKENILQKKNFA